jgi:hypothetical protein
MTTAIYVIVTPEQKARYSEAARLRGVTLRAFVTAVLDQAVGDQSRSSLGLELRLTALENRLHALDERLSYQLNHPDGCTCTKCTG